MQKNIAIIGNGLSALLSAISISKLGINVQLFDQKKSLHESNLVTFLSEHSLGFINKLGFEKKLFLSYENINEIECLYFNKKTEKKTELNFISSNENLMGKILPNKFLYNTIYEKLLKIPNIKIHSDIIKAIEFNDGYVTLEANNNIFKTNLVIVADGKNSFIKKILPNNFITKQFNQTALSINLELERISQNKAYQYFTKDGPLAVLPVTNKTSSIVWSLKNNSEILKFSSQELEDKIKKIMGSDYKSLKLSTVEKYPLSFQYSKKITYKNLVIIGDTAHSIHPLAGQGLNLTIKDIVSLSSIIRKYLNLGYEIQSNLILDDFANVRSADNATYSFSTMFMSNLFLSENKIINKSIELSFKVLNRIPMIKNKIIKSATGVNYQ